MTRNYSKLNMNSTETDYLEGKIRKYQMDYILYIMALTNKYIDRLFQLYVHIFQQKIFCKFFNHITLADHTCSIAWLVNLEFIGTSRKHVNNRNYSSCCLRSISKVQVTKI